MSGDEIEIESEAHPAWLSPAVWATLSFLAFVVFELTAEPALASVVLALKFGWNDFRTGLWLWRTDPNAGRGMACFWFSLMIGVLHVSIAAFLLCVVIVVAVLSAGGGAAGGAGKPLPGVVALFFLIMIAELLVMLLGLTGCIVARYYQVRVWISPMLHRARMTGTWPPEYDAARDAKNTGERVLAFSVVFCIVLIITGSMLLTLEWKLPVLPVIAVALLLAGSIFWFCRGVPAEKYTECWPESEIALRERLDG